MRNNTHSAPPVLPSINICNNVAGGLQQQTWLQNECETSASASASAAAEGKTRSSAEKLQVTVDATRARSSYEVLKMCVDALGWKEHIPGSKDHESLSSDIYWNAVHFSETSAITSGKVNKFPGMVEAVKKVSLGRSLENMRRLFPDEYSFYPKSWFLPQQLQEFRLEASLATSGETLPKTSKVMATLDAKASHTNTSVTTSAVHASTTIITAGTPAEKNSPSEESEASPVSGGPTLGKRARVALGRLYRHRNSLSSSELLPGAKFTLASSSSPTPLFSSSSSSFGTCEFLNESKSAFKSEGGNFTSQRSPFPATTTEDHSAAGTSPVSSPSPPTPPPPSIPQDQGTKPQQNSATVYIIKPDEGSQGEGIYLIRDPKEYVIESDSRKKHVAQEYVAQPLLLDGLKFDLRVYVALVSIEPLIVYMCKEGLARFCTQPYKRPTQKNIHNPFMHLTNYSLNKRSKDYLHTESAHDGSKRSLTNVFRQLKLLGFDVDLIVTQIKDVIVKTLIALLPDLRMEYSRQVPRKCADSISCFQILGFDVLLTSEGKPVLLEVNSSPSLRLDFEFHSCSGASKSLGSPVDEEVKRRLVMDTLLLVAPKYKTANEGRCGGGVSERTIQLFKCPQHCGYNSLEKIYPSDTDAYDRFMVLDRAARVFFASLSVTDVNGMNSVCFKAFTKKCHIATNSLPGAVLDLIFLDTTRQMGLLHSETGPHSNNNFNSNNNNNNNTKILRLQMRDFIHAFICIAQQRYSHQQSAKERKGYLRYKKSDKRNLKQLLLANSSGGTQQQRLLEYFEMLLLHCESYLNLAADGTDQKSVCVKEHHRSSLDSATKNQSSVTRDSISKTSSTTTTTTTTYPSLDDNKTLTRTGEKHFDGTRMFLKKESIRSTRKFSRHANLSAERTSSYDGSLFYSSLVSPSSSPNLFSPLMTQSSSTTATGGGRTTRMPAILSPLSKISPKFLPHVSSLPSLNLEGSSAASQDTIKIGNFPKRMHSERLRSPVDRRTWTNSSRRALISRASDQE